MKKIKLKVDEYEYGLIVKAIFEFRNNKMENGSAVNFETEVLTKLLEKTN